MEQKLYSTPEEFLTDLSESGKNRYLQQRLALRQMGGKELILRGKESPGESCPRALKLIEILLKGPIATTDFECSVGILAWRAVPCPTGGWDTYRIRYDLAGQIKERVWQEWSPTESIAWGIADFCFESYQRSGYGASPATMLAVPIDCVGYTERDFGEQLVACINVEKFCQPYFFELCLELGLDTALKPTDMRLLVAKKQDWIYLHGWPKYLPEKYRDYTQQFADADARGKAIRTPEARMRMRVYRHVAKFWHIAGLSCLPQQDLVNRINDYFGTDYSLESVTRQCQRLRLLSKHRGVPKRMPLHGADLDYAVEAIDHPPAIAIVIG